MLTSIINQNLLEDYFIGTYEHSIMCSVCHSVFTSTEKFLDISLSFSSKESCNPFTRLTSLRCQKTKLQTWTFRVFWSLISRQKSSKEWTSMSAERVRASKTRGRRLELSIYPSTLCSLSTGSSMTSRLSRRSNSFSLWLCLRRSI